MESYSGKPITNGNARVDVKAIEVTLEEYSKTTNSNLNKTSTSNKTTTTTNLDLNNFTDDISPTFSKVDVEGTRATNRVDDLLKEKIDVKKAIEKEPKNVEVTLEEEVEVLDETPPVNNQVDVSKYNSKPEVGFEVTTGNTTYELSDEDFDFLCAIVAAESDHSFDDALAVSSVILNRCENDAWVYSCGEGPIKQVTAKGQFDVYRSGSYKQYLNGNAPAEVTQALRDALAGVRNNGYLSFRSNGSKSYSGNMITSSGNRYK